MKIKFFNKDRVIIALIFCIFIPFWILRFRTIGTGSDIFNFLLEAKDILSGNIFLNNWYLTGLLFGNDLIYYIIGVLFFGVTTKGYQVSTFLIYITFIIVSIFLLKIKNKNITWKKVLVFLLLVGIPNKLVILNYMTHTGSITLGFIGIYIINKYFMNEKQTKKQIILILLFLTFSAFDDILGLIAILLPVLSYSLYNLLYEYFKYSYIKNNKHKIIAIISIVSGILGQIINKMYFFLGSAYKNSYLEHRKFNSLNDAWVKKIPLYIESVLKIIDADIFERKIISIDTVGMLIRLGIFGIGLYFIIKNIHSWLKLKGNDYISSVLGLGYVFLSLFYILSDNVSTLGHSRYINFLGVFFAIIVIRNSELYIFNNLKNYKKFSLIMGLLLLLSINRKEFSIRRSPDFKYFDEITQVLLENNLKSGIASYWYSSEITGTSGGKVKVRAVYMNSEGIANWNWSNKLNWYKEFINFVMIKEGDTDFGITEQNVLKTFGNPSKKIKIPNLGIIIYVYDRDISKDIKYNEIGVY